MTAAVFAFKSEKPFESFVSPVCACAMPRCIRAPNDPACWPAAFICWPSVPYALPSRRSSASVCATMRCCRRRFVSARDAAALSIPLVFCASFRTAARTCSFCFCTSNWRLIASYLTLSLSSSVPAPSSFVRSMSMRSFSCVSLLLSRAIACETVLPAVSKSSCNWAMSSPRLK